MKPYHYETLRVRFIIDRRIFLSDLSVCYQLRRRKLKIYLDYDINHLEV